MAFQWCQEGRKCHIYIKQVAEEPPTQLTNAGVDDLSPAWSPDGHFIAFLRELDLKKRALILIPQRGGRERQLDTWDVSKVRTEPLKGPHLAWTPDSKWLAFPYLEENHRDQALFLISVETREKRRLTNPAGDLRGDTSPAFSPDGSRLVFNREHVIVAAELYVLYLGENYSPKGEPKRLDTGNVWNLGAAWTPDGQEILISSGIYPMPGLWRMEVLKQGKPVKLNLPYDNIWAPSISRLGKRLAYSVGTNDSNIWGVNMEGAGWKPSRPVPFIASTKFEAEPAFSPDGRRVAFISSQFGPREIWMCDSDGRNPVQLASMNADLQGPRWSPDGQSIAFAAEAK